MIARGPPANALPVDAHRRSFSPSPALRSVPPSLVLQFLMFAVALGYAQSIHPESLNIAGSGTGRAVTAVLLPAILLMRADLDDANWLGTTRNRVSLALLATFFVLSVATAGDGDRFVRTIVSVFGLAGTLLEVISRKLAAPISNGATKALKIEQFCRRCGAENVRFMRGGAPEPSRP